jgi:pimeloyl-ACP methyl ester carboxylesterase
VALALDRDGSGDPLVLLHGVGTNRIIWRRALPYLTAQRMVIALDLPGFGDSPPIGPGFDLGPVGAAVATAALQSAGGPFDLLGHSLGGAVAVRLAADRPDLVRRLLLSAPAGFAPKHPLLAGAAGAVAPRFLGLRRAVASPLASVPLARRVALAGAVADGSRLDPAAARTMLGASRGATRIGQAIETVARADLRDDLAALAVPIGLIWGERDRVVPIGTVAAIERAAGPLPMARIPDAGHVTQLERPLQFAAAVDSLLERL